MTPKQCCICKKYVNKHTSLTCIICSCAYHTKCLPYLQINDVKLITNWHCIKCISPILPFNHFKNYYDFLNAISDDWFDVTNISFCDLQNKLLNPFDLNNNSHSFPMYNNDPDLQYFNNVYSAVQNNCDYFVEDTFINKCAQLSTMNKMFSLLHINIRSISKHLHELDQYLHVLNHNFSVIGISEIWCQDYNVNSCDLPGYKAEHIYRHTKVGGGVALYIKDNIAYHTRLDITKLNDYIECQFIEIHKDSNSYGKDIIVGIIYRPPNNDINKCIDEMSNILDILNNENKLCYIMGDFNINLFNHEVHAPTCIFLT